MSLSRPACSSGDYDAFVSGGDWFSYNLTARAQIFARNHSMVVDEPSFRSLMRYNDFQNDPIATQGCGDNPTHSAENAIAGAYSCFLALRNHM